MSQKECGSEKTPEVEKKSFWGVVEFLGILVAKIDF